MNLPQLPRSVLLPFGLVFFVVATSLLTVKPTTIVQSEPTERVFENQIPKHVPIEFKLKKDKEKSVKDLGNEKWVRDLQIEIKNLSDKPIYFLDLWVEFPEYATSSGVTGFVMRYGRINFVHFNVFATPEDIPILPGKTLVMEVPASQQAGWENQRRRHLLGNPKTVFITFTQLSYGDGTGFNGGTATPYPYHKEHP